MAAVTAMRWVRRCLTNVAALLAAPALLCAAYLLDQAYPVVRDFRVITQVVTPEGVLIEGVMNKQRDCRFVEVVAMLDKVPSEVVFLDLEKRPTYSRVTGPQRWGPWLVQARPGQGVVLHAYHRCHFAWEHSEILGSFVVELKGIL